ncbi:sodium-solute symporter [Vibrio ishigakensis]|uniref:Sodium-solute symporter n=1 Tax=Vibrio ishigakensis TaxID=1481914 RepID=A0A0B8P1T2_9VIBR|nr:sodium-solute symporter [Vibrio ishigakensis]
MADIKVALGLVGHMVITAGFFCATTMFFKPLEEQRQKM